MTPRRRRRNSCWVNGNTDPTGQYAAGPNSREIINGAQLDNKQLASGLSSNGGNLGDWGKYMTQTFRSLSGPFQVHFYYNSATGDH
jgi:hypothetical protein